MNIIKVKLFSTPYVVKDGEKINFPFMKAEALFYYLVVNKKATRDELVTLFWSDSPDKVAKKNLRNAMYKIRKTFDMDIIISPQKSIVFLNPDIVVRSDLELLLNSDNDCINIYDGEFLKGFGVKNAEGFENWLFSKRQYYKDIYISKLYNLIDNFLEKKNFEKAEECAKLIIAEDEFDERPYRVLMNVYKNQGVYNKAIELYNKLENLLETELGITPDIKTKNIIHDIKKNRKAKQISYDNSLDGLFYGREEEVNYFNKNFLFFMDDKEYKSILIRGEAGIGKTRLKDKFKEFIEQEKVYLFETNCYQAEKGYFLKPWNEIFLKLANIIEKDDINIPLAWRKMISYLFPVFDKEQCLDNKNPVEVLDTLKFSVIEEVIHGVIKKIIEKRKIAFIFEDIQWIDDLSLSLLSNIMLRNNNIILITTCRNGYYEKIDRFITMLKFYDLIDILELRRFTKDEMEDFINKYLKEHRIKNKTKEKIYRETEGNTFFLIEYLNMIKSKGDLDTCISPKMKDILKSKFIGISDEGKKILNIVAIFFDKATLNIIKDLSGKDELEIVEVMEELHNKYIIDEVGGEEISYRFTHQKLREYVYNSLSVAKRKVLHNKAGQIIEKSLKNDKRDVSIYPKLIYHYSNSGNIINTLKYTIKYLDSYLDVKHELFPVMNYVGFNEPNFNNMSSKKILKYFNDIEKLFSRLKKIEKEDEDVIRLKIAYLHIRGRYLIREGEYEEGKKNIEEMINKSLSIKSFKYALKGYRQNIYYGIQVYDVLFMKKNIDKGLEIAYSYGSKEDIGIFLRLKGLNKIMMEEYGKAEELLKKSIRAFNAINNDKGKYSLNIAACYNYIGEIRRHNMEFSQALTYYDKAMKICKEKSLLRGLTIFNTNAGQAAFEKGDYLKAKEYLNKAMEIYEQIDTLWGRSIAEGFLALIRCKEGKYNLALKHLKNAEYYADKLKSPLEIGLVYRVKAEIKANMENNQNLNNFFSEYLKLSLNEYCDMGIKHLRKVKEGYEIEILKALNK
ncbi:tetratricopeptide repeat protein [Paramaledivibacter caminithermalis]|uniref:Predicted ATPase n=1 Tax=Paramaledivibacter caminithermalis (strain DSM 15212 / CIP 107654 / DViRD3) TaxID=1121301 RepID=A0A1M6STA1_PARC5|nr:tetratricopeptide repeat protein [Paramaledivibacter caminithermalis]SHK47860.1 Predicted ATPase [Paramaledivibacter caminithermalis DSM 15212]